MSTASLLISVDYFRLFSSRKQSKETDFLKIKHLRYVLYGVFGDFLGREAMRETNNLLVDQEKY